jgi:hypothetical protein
VLIDTAASVDTRNDAAFQAQKLLAISPAKFKQDEKQSAVYVAWTVAGNLITAAHWQRRRAPEQ